MIYSWIFRPVMWKDALRNSLVLDAEAAFTLIFPTLPFVSSHSLSVIFHSTCSPAMADVSEKSCQWSIKIMRAEGKQLYRHWTWKKIWYFVRLWTNSVIGNSLLNVTLWCDEHNWLIQSIYANLVQDNEKEARSLFDIERFNQLC